MKHQELAEKVTENLKKIEGISKVILYGSVARNQERPDSDLDIAVIIQNEMKLFPLDMEGFPIGFREQIVGIISQLEREYKIKIHMPFYYESEYQEGIELYGGGDNPIDILNEVGLIKFDFFEDKQ